MKVICQHTLSLPCPCLAMASYLIFPSASTCTARALFVLLFRPISRGNWATWISGKAPPSPKSYRDTDYTANVNINFMFSGLHHSVAVSYAIKCGTSHKQYPQPPNKQTRKPVQTLVYYLKSI